MKHALVALCGFLAMASGVAAQDEPLPQEVAQAYLAYEAAVEAQDYVAASTAGEAAFHAARSAGLETGLQLTLGANALAVAEYRHRGAGLVGLTRAVAGLAQVTGDTELVFELRVRGLRAAMATRNYVAFEPLLNDALDYAVDAEVRSEAALEWLGSIRDPRWLVSAGDEADAVFAAASTETDAILAANLAIDRQLEAIAREDWPEALAITESVVARLVTHPGDSRDAVDGVLTGLTQILPTGLGATDAGTEHLSAVTAQRWCDLLERRLMIAYPYYEMQVPMRAAERLEQGVLRLPFRMMSDGAHAERGDLESSFRTGAFYARTATDYVETLPFIPACQTDATPADGVLRVSFISSPTGNRLGAYTVTFRLLHSVQ